MVDAVGDRAEVYVDGGILSGSDIVAAVALGARAALVGRAYLYGLMAGGERGVQRAARHPARTRSPAPWRCSASRGSPTSAATMYGCVRPEVGSADGRHRVHAHPRAVRLHVRRRRPGDADQARAPRCGCGPTTRSVARCAASTTCPARRSTCGSSTRRPARSTSRAPSPATRSCCTSSTLEPARDWGASAAIPFFGGMTSTDRVVTLQDPLPDTTWIYELDRDRNTVAFAARHSDHRIELPVEPMLGTVGVAPAGGEVRSSLVPDRFGGNMDTPQMRAGATVYPRRQRRGRDVLHRRRPLPPGRGRGLRHRGRGRDDHDPDRRADQGRRPRLAADRGRHALDDGRARAGRWRTPGGSATPSSSTGSASSTACTRWTPTSSARRSRRCPIANVVDANYSVVVKAAKALLPAADAFGGIHADLRARRPLPRHPLNVTRRHSHRKAASMDLQLNGKRVLVTGGTRGIGRAIVEAFLDEGAVVGFCARNADEVAATQEALRGPRQRHRAAVDVGDGDALAAWVEQSADALRRPRRRRGQRQRPRDPRHRGELAGSASTST